ncbi:LptA/OstA family protein [uncultured Deinococcus sp.]|uniref:LptA/OstA family protein n=1 Tax=uncultured Deinococcus sp. TaxID=158789 RepID=UPI0025FD2E6F|nr:LptA/OstA family protein [uncultured Deinococcus sp.]
MVLLRRPMAVLLTLTLLGGPPGGVSPLALAQETTPAPAPAPSTPAQTTPAQTTPAPDAAPADTPEAAPADTAGAENASLELVRRGEKDGKERRIKIVRTGTSDDTGIFATCGPQDGDPENAPNLAVFSETTQSGIQITIDKNVIRVPLAVVTQQQPKEGQDGSDGRVEASAGTAKFLDAAPEGATDRLSKCGIETTPKPAPDTVFVTQGKTQLKGQKLLYDEADGIARIDGPITFTRPNQSDPLSGTSEKIEVDVDQEKTTLVGNVVLNSGGGRVSKAARVEYDDTRNVARLIGTPGQPAQSVKGGDTLSAGMILYDLDRNEVYAVKPEGGTITGEFQDGEAAAPTTPTPAPTTPPGSTSPP